MKIVTIGMSPYLLTSKSRINASVLKRLYKEGHGILGLVWSHNESYHVPQETDGKKSFYYKFQDKDNQKHSIPIVPLPVEKREIAVYEILRKLQPDIVVAIGDFADIPYLKAVRMFLAPTGNQETKWLFVLSSYASPINENSLPLLDDIDGIMCASPFSERVVQDHFKKDILHTKFFGYDEVFDNVDCSGPNKDEFRIMVCGKNSSSDNIPTIMQIADDLKKDISELKLYVHANVYDAGDYDLNLVKDRLDPDSEFISFPSKFVSTVDGIPDEELAVEYGSSHVFVSIPVVSSTSMTVFESMSHGCYPVLSDCGSNRFLAEELEEYLGDYSADDFIVRTIKVMIPGESYIHMVDPDDLKKKILNAQIKIKNDQGLRLRFVEFTKKYQREGFLQELADVIDKVKKTDPVICLETI